MKKKFSATKLKQLEKEAIYWGSVLGGKHPAGDKLVKAILNKIQELKKDNEKKLSS